MKKKLKFWIFLIVSISWMTVIFLYSSKNAEISSQNSNRVGMIVGRIFVPHFEDLSEAEQWAFAGRIDKPVRKTAHACEYAVLGFLIMGTVLSYTIGTEISRRRRIIRAFGAWLFSTVYAVSDELHQYFVPGRTCKITDVCIDSAGAMLGVLAACLLFYLIKRRHRSDGNGEKQNLV